jgi:hypothetical protein
VSHLGNHDVGIILKTLTYKLFSSTEVVNTSRTGKKTVNSGDKPKPALDSTKFEALQRAVMTKCGITIDIFKKKFDNFLKVERRRNLVEATKQS